MYTLYYGKGIDLSADVEKHEFKTIKELINFIDLIYLNNEDNIVYLCADEDDKSEGEIFISENTYSFVSYLESYEHLDKETYFLQEYDSYETAYKVALDIREPNRLCYKKN